MEPTDLHAVSKLLGRVVGVGGATCEKGCGNGEDVNKLTGSESKLNYDGERVDTVTRNKDRIQYVDVDAERKRAHEEYQVDTGYRGQQK